MASSAEQPARVPATIPWYIWSSIVAVTSAMAGTHWDIAWHRSIGRDTFWTPAHIAIYLCGVISGVGCGYLILSTSLNGASLLKKVSVKIWGFRGPLGAFIAAWGGIAMITSAPFDDWWHRAYGLDVRIISPPHMVLAAGFFGIELGTVMLMLAFMNRATEATRRRLQWLFLYVGGMAVSESLLIKMEYIARPDMHTALFYIVVVLGTPAILIAIAVASGQRWAATAMACLYTAFGVAFLWILPLFHAEPKLGPVYRQITHFIPWEFPLLIVVPSVAIDLILQRTDSWRPIVRGPITGIAFLATFIVVQWPFANFLMTPLARNWFFGAEYMDYGTPPRSAYARNVFVTREAIATQFWRGMLIAALMACLMMWVGVHVGRRMRKVRR